MRAAKILIIIAVVAALMTYVVSSGYSDGFFGIPLRCSLDTCIRAVEGNNGDFANYLRAADLLIQGKLITDQSNWWLIILWPPGMAAYFATLSILSLGTSTFSVVHLGVSIGLWTFLLTWSIIQGKDIRSLVIGAMSATLLLGSAPFRNWMFGDSIFYSETISIGLFSLSIATLCLAVMRVDSRSLKSLIAISGASGLLMAISSYLRAVFDLVGLALTAIFVILLAISVLRTKFSCGNSSENFNSTSRTTDKSLMVVLASWLISFLGTTLPWRLVLARNLGLSSVTFSPASPQVWASGWIPNEHGLPDWALSAGINGFCVSYPETCAAIAVAEYASNSPYSGFGAYTYDQFRSAALGEILTNPMPWLISRADFAIKNLLTAAGGVQVWGLILILSSSIALFCATMTLHRSLSSSFHRVSRLILSFIPLGSGIFTVVPLMVGSYEPRYFYPILIMPLVVRTFLTARPEGSGVREITES